MIVTEDGARALIAITSTHEALELPDAAGDAGAVSTNTSPLASISLSSPSATLSDAPMPSIVLTLVLRMRVTCTSRRLS